MRAGIGSRLLVAAPTTVLAVAFLWPLWHGQIYADLDLAALHLPLRAGYAEALAAGQWPLWEPRIHCGMPILAEGQLGACHPLHLLLYRLLPLSLAFMLELASAYVFGFIGMLLWLRRRRASGELQLFAAGMFAGGTFALAHVVHPNMIGVFLHLPWLLIAVEALAAAGGRRAVIRAILALGLLLSSQVLLGHPPSVWLSGLVWGSYALWLLPRFRLACALPAALGLMLLVGAVQWLPTWMLLQQTERAAGAPDFVNQYSLHVANLLQLVAPYASQPRTIADPISGNSLTEFAIYPGFGLLLLALHGLLAPTDRRQRNWLLGALILSLLLMLGRYGGINQLTAMLPVVQSFRVPARYSAVMQFLLLILAWRGLAAMTAGRWPSRYLTWSLAAAAVVVHLGYWAWRGQPPTVATLWLLLVVVPTACLCSRRRQWALPVLMALTLADVAVFGFTAGPGPLRRLPITELQGALAGRQTVDSRYRIMRPWNEGVLDGYYNIEAYLTLEPQAHFNLTDNAFIRLLSGRWVQLGGQLYEIPNPLPRFRLVGRTAALSVAPERMSYEGLDIDGTVWLPPDELVPLNSTVGTLQVIRDEPNEAVVRVVGAERQLLIWADRWDPDWQCDLDGTPVAIAKAYGVVRGVVVPPGEHRLQFRYLPLHFLIAQALSAFGLLVVLLLYGCSRGRRTSGIGAEPAEII